MSDEEPQKMDSEEIVTNKSNTRFKKRFMKRQWEDPDEGSSDSKKLCDPDKPTERIKRKKVAMLMGYSGVGYFGMQRNPGVETIEEELLKALLAAKYITEDDFENQQNIQFQRSSRTDKNVSAARQVVSLKLPLEISIEEINKWLPDSIRVFGVKRVINKFNSKLKCNARSYIYIIPTYAFDTSVTTPEDRKQYRITPAKLQKLDKVFDIYKGTRGFHNFTEKKHFQDPSASRYIMGFKVDNVFKDSDMEFATLLVKGQSFMLHQIRKMVGLIVAFIREDIDRQMVDKAFGRDKVIIPTAPGLGLVLEMVHYDKYNTKFKDTHESLTWESEHEAVDKFKKQFIYPTIVKGEKEDYSMGTWLDTKLAQHVYEPREPYPGEKLEENSQPSTFEGSDDEAESTDEDKLEICEEKYSNDDLSNESTTTDGTNKAKNDLPNSDSSSSGDLCIIDITSDDSCNNVEIISVENPHIENPNLAAKDEDEVTEEKVDESAGDSAKAIASDNVGADIKQPKEESPKGDDRNIIQSTKVDKPNGETADVIPQN